MTWSVLLPLIVAVLQSELPARLAAWLADALRKWVAAQPPTAVVAFGAAPDEIRQTILDLLKSAVAAIDRPVVRKLVGLGLDLFGGRLVDAIWDSLFAAGHLAVARPPAPALAAAAADPAAADLEAALAALPDGPAVAA